MLGSLPCVFQIIYIKFGAGLDGCMLKVLNFPSANFGNCVLHAFDIAILKQHTNLDTYVHTWTFDMNICIDVYIPLFVFEIQYKVLTLMYTYIYFGIHCASIHIITVAKHFMWNTMHQYVKIYIKWSMMQLKKKILMKFT